MPFEVRTIDLAQYPSLDSNPTLFPPETWLRKRLDQNKVQKQKVAWAVAKEWFAEQVRDVFVTDGSSTFYVCLALALLQDPRTVKLYTNNVAFSSEMDGRQSVPGFELELLGGHKDPILSATLGTEAERQAKAILGKTNLAIASVRQLVAEKGPTTIEWQSRGIKEIVLKQASMLVFVLDWKKLATPPIDVPALVFPHNRQEEWNRILETVTVCFVSCAPPGIANGYEEGRKIKASNRPAGALGREERYALNVFKLSQYENVTFVEVR